MRFWNRFRLRTRGSRLETELASEIRQHREMLEEEFRREGMTSAAEAARAPPNNLGTVPPQPT